ncbi:MAG: phosphotransferase [Pseudomonadota bacterium]
MPLREAAIAAFLAAGDWRDAALDPLPGDASTRRYARLRRPDGAGAMLMDAPPDTAQSVIPFVDMTARLRGVGLSAPALYQTDPALGLLLMEDLGDDLFARLLQRQPDLERELYAAAVDLLAVLQAEPSLAHGLPDYDRQIHHREALLALDWYAPPTDRAAGARQVYLALIDDLIAGLTPAPPVCVLIDYHAENLVWLPQRAGHERVGLLDYQDARAGHPAYDLVSLLQDARRDVGLDLQARMRARFAAAAGVAPAALDADCARLGAHRNLKILGLFARLARRDGKPRYVDMIPRVWDHLQTDLAHADLAPLRDWVARHLPPPTPAVLAGLRRGAAA